MTENSSSEARKLKREIGFVALLFTAVTGIIGSGWLFASLYAAQYAGPGSLISWVIGGGISIILTLVFAEMGGMVPVAGAIARIPYFSHGTLSSFGRVALLDSLRHNCANRSNRHTGLLLKLSALAYYK